MSTYLELTNMVLRRLNEVPLTQQTFNSARSIQATAKLAVLDAVAKINNHYYKWPFNAVETTVPMVQGQEEYAFPPTFKAADWNSFYVLKNDSLNTRTKKLIKISKNDWYTKLRPRDYDAEGAGIRQPQYVFEGHTRGFGISASPNNVWTIGYRYFRSPPLMTTSSSTCTIPVEFEDVIVDGALYVMKMFKENAEIANEYKQAFKNGLSNMRTILINDYDYMQDTRVDQNGVGSNGR